MKKHNHLFFFIILTMYSIMSFGQSSLKEDSINFCGAYFISPNNCETVGSLIKCNNYVFSWMNEPIEDLPRHKKEMFAQIKNRKKVSLSVLNDDNTGYLAKVAKGYQLIVIGLVNGQGVIIYLWQDEPIKSTSDLPEYIRQFIAIK